MGGGISAPSVNRLRKTIVIRAYNLRKNNETLHEQLRPFATRSPDTNKLFLSLLDVKSSLQLEDGSLWTSIERLLIHCVGPAVRSDGIDYDVFIAFLESGKLPLQTLPSSASAGNILLQETETDATPVATKSTLPSPPPTMRKPDLRVDTLAHESPLQTSSSAPEDSTNPIASPHPYFVEQADSPTPQQQTIGGSQAFFAAEQSTELNALIISGTRSGGAIQTQSGKPLWKKKETTKVERTVEYTTIDADGLLQELLEHEITETEILHMECKETGEFAHRETTEFQQREVFNKEVVSEQTGTEEYLHLKSLDDEIEYMDSSMPQKQPQEPDRERGREEAERDATTTEADGAAGGEGTYDAEETYQEYLYRQAMANVQVETAVATDTVVGDACDRMPHEQVCDGSDSFPQVRNPQLNVRPAPPRRPPQDVNRGFYGDFNDDEYARECLSSSSGSGPGGSSTPIRDPHTINDVCSEGYHGENVYVDINEQQQRNRQRMHLFDPTSPLAVPSKLRGDGMGDVDAGDDNWRQVAHETQETQIEDTNGLNRRGSCGSMLDID